MDFPKSVPSVGLVDGKFIDEDAVAGTPGSLIPSSWGNAVTLEIINVIQGAGLEPDEDDNTQLSSAIDQKIAGSSVQFASQPEAEAGESTTKAMSPLRVFQAIAKVVTQATEGAFGWLKIATQTQVGTGSDDSAAVTSKKLAIANQLQIHSAFTTGGTATALTLAPTPPIGAYAQNQRFNVRFNVAAGANPTLNVSGKGPKALKQYDATGAKVAAVFVADQISDVIYDGVDLVLMDQLPASGQSISGAQGAFTNLKASANGSSAQILISADEILLESAAGTYLTVRSVGATLNSSTVGANGLDVGPLEANTWYSTWIISNGTTAASIASKSATSPALPGGFTHKARTGWFRSGPTGSFFPLAFSQVGRSVVYNTTPLPVMGSGVVADNTAVAWATFFPPTVAKISLSCRHGNGAQVRFSTSPNYDLYYARYKDGITGTGTVTGMTPLGPNVYWGAVAGLDGTPELRAYGWEDNL